jgi:hypothetical protein
MSGFSENGLLSRDGGGAIYIVIPAGISDAPIIPPPEHVLDYLVRNECSDTESPEVQAEFPGAGTVAVVETLPLCDLCKSQGILEALARYDAREQDNGWAFMCWSCFKTSSAGRLGWGEGQYLMLKSEVPQAVYEAKDRALAYWRTRG